MYMFGYIFVCMIYIIGDVVFVGDILFMLDYGIVRCDFFGGDVVMFYMLIQFIFVLFDEMWFFMCYDYFLLV